MVLFCRRFPIVSEYIKSKRNDRKRNNKVGKTKPARGVKAKRKDRPSETNPRLRIFSNSKSSSYEKIEKKLQKNLVDWKSRCNFAKC